MDDLGVTVDDHCDETAERAWADMLRAHQPPHPANDWFTPLFWPLLQAAYGQPVLRRLYAGQSMTFLGFFDTALWWTEPSEQLSTRPGVATLSTGSYTVVTGWGSPSPVELLATQDPVTAASHIADLLATW